MEDEIKEVETKKKEKSMSKKAIQMRELRAKRKRPRCISPDFRKEVCDVIEEKDGKGHKKRRGKVEYIFNINKAKIFLWKLKYQTYTHWTNFIFFDKKGNKIELDFTKHHLLDDYVLNDKIDLSKGIYAYRIHHRRVDYSNISYINYSLEGLYFELRDFIKRDYRVEADLKDGTRALIYNLKHLKEVKDQLNFHGFIRVVSNKPKYKDTDRWNEEIGGYWLMLSRLCGPEEVEHYERDIKLTKCLSFAYENENMYKNLIRMGKASKAMYYLNKLDMFSLKRTIENQINDQAIVQATKFYGKYMGNTIDGIKSFINSVIAYHPFSGNLTNHIQYKLSRILKVKYEAGPKDEYNDDESYNSKLVRVRNNNLELFGYDKCIEYFGIDYCDDFWLSTLQAYEIYRYGDDADKIGTREEEIELARKKYKPDYVPFSKEQKEYLDGIIKDNSLDRVNWIVGLYESIPQEEREEHIPDSLVEYTEYIKTLETEADKERKEREARELKWRLMEEQQRLEEEEYARRNSTAY